MEENDIEYQYYIDTRKLFEMVSSSKKTTNKESEITTGFEADGKGKLGATSKVVREITSKGDTFIDNLKYDFMKSLIMITIEGWDDRDVDITQQPGTQMCLNTLLKDGVVVRVKVEKTTEEEEE